MTDSERKYLEYRLETAKKKYQPYLEQVQFKKEYDDKKKEIESKIKALEADTEELKSLQGKKKFDKFADRISLAEKKAIDEQQAKIESCEKRQKENHEQLSHYSVATLRYKLEEFDKTLKDLYSKKERLETEIDEEFDLDKKAKLQEQLDSILEQIKETKKEREQEASKEPEIESKRKLYLSDNQATLKSKETAIKKLEELKNNSVERIKKEIATKLAKNASDLKETKESLESYIAKNEMRYTAAKEDIKEGKEFYDNLEKQIIELSKQLGIKVNLKSETKAVSKTKKIEPEVSSIGIKEEPLVKKAVEERPVEKSNVPNMPEVPTFDELQPIKVTDLNEEIKKEEPSITGDFDLILPLQKERKQESDKDATIEIPVDTNDFNFNLPEEKEESKEESKEKVIEEMVDTSDFDLEIPVETAKEEKEEDLEKKPLAEMIDINDFNLEIPNEQIEKEKEQEESEQIEVRQSFGSRVIKVAKDVVQYLENVVEKVKDFAIVKEPEFEETDTMEYTDLPATDVESSPVIEAEPENVDKPDYPEEQKEPVALANDEEIEPEEQSEENIIIPDMPPVEEETKEETTRLEEPAQETTVEEAIRRARALDSKEFKVPENQSSKLYRDDSTQEVDNVNESFIAPGAQLSADALNELRAQLGMVPFEEKEEKTHSL